MADHVICELHIEGPNGVIDEIEEFAKGPAGDLDFERIVPMPSSIKKDGPEGGPRHWITWRIDKWGTKTNAPTLDGIIKEWRDENNLVFRFRTAWYAPDLVLAELSRLFPDAQLKLTHHDEGFPGTVYRDLFVAGEGSGIEEDVDADDAEGA
jgi:hypothetical protein